MADLNPTNPDVPLSELPKEEKMQRAGSFGTVAARLRALPSWTAH